MYPDRHQKARNEDRPSSRTGYHSGATTSKGSRDGAGDMTRIEPSGRNSALSSTGRGVTPVIIEDQNDIFSVAFLGDGKHVLGCGSCDKKWLRRWRVDDGREAGTLVSAESDIRSMAVSSDGKWIAVGTLNGCVEVWNAETNEKMKQWNVHSRPVYAVDVSQDGQIASGSTDQTACVWSGEELLTLQHNDDVVKVKFSPDGRLVATVSFNLVYGAQSFTRIYDAGNGELLVNVAIEPPTIAWTGDGKQLFVLPRNDVNIRCIDAFTGATLAKWPVRDSVVGGCITYNGAFLAASSGSSVSFWDTSTLKQVGSVLQLTHHVSFMVISGDLHLAACGDGKATLRSLRDILTMPYDPLKDVEEPRAQLAEAQQAHQQSDDLVRFLRAEGLTSDAKIVQLEKTIQDLHDKLALSQRATDDQRKINNSLRADLSAQKINMDLQIQDLRNQLSISHREQDQLNKTIGSFRAQEVNLKKEIVHLQQNGRQLCNDLVESLRRDPHTQETASIRLNQIICAHEQKHKCETLYAQGRILDAAESVCETETTLNRVIEGDKFLSDWHANFVQRCVISLEQIGDGATIADKQDEAVGAYATALSLSPLTPNNVLMGWARAILNSRLASEAFGDTTKFKVPRASIYHAICNVLEEGGRITEAVECFRQMKNELPDDNTDEEKTKWECNFRERCTEKLVGLGDAASNAKRHEEAIEYYSRAILLEPAKSYEILLKRGNELIQLNPLSPEGYEERCSALHGMQCYSESFGAFQSVLSMLERSPDPQMQERHQRYLDVTPKIQQAIQQTISSMPRVLIDTETGCLHNKTQQAAMFEELPIFNELRSSMTTRTRLDTARIQGEVKDFYRYVMFSHRWEANGEPVLQDVQNSTVYVLEETSPNIKLKSLCRIVRRLGFKWVWSDTCCIDKKDNVVLQESLVAMFSWYRGSAMTLIYLRDVSSHLQRPGHLQRSVWNSRAWTYQEYLAAKTVQFYTEDWKPYLDLAVFNHKEAPEIIREMEPESGVSSRELALLRPGLDRVREKLSLASARKTTYPEDIAYSLLGIFKASIPVIYGEGDRAVGRLLEHVLTGSGDVSILAWTGHAGEYNSCLPTDLSVYERVIPPHIPQPIETSAINHVIARLHSSSQLDHSLLETLYHRLRYLPKLRMAASRLELPGIVFQIPELVRMSGPDLETKVSVYHTTTLAFGDVEIQTAEDLSGMADLVLVHPWIRPLIHQELKNGANALDETTQSLRLLARIQQPFGALLFQSVDPMEYRRVATDSLIMVQIREVSLADLIKNIVTIEVR